MAKDSLSVLQLLTALALFVSYAEAVQLKTIDILNAHVIVGLFIGGMLTFLFSAMTMESVSKAAHEMIEEVRRQFHEDAGILKGTSRPDYASCVSISTNAALKEMFLPGLMAVLAPITVGLILGPDALGGLLTGALLTGVLMAIFMSNSGGAGITQRSISKKVIMAAREVQLIKLLL